MATEKALQKAHAIIGQRSCPIMASRFGRSGGEYTRITARHTYFGLAACFRTPIKFLSHLIQISHGWIVVVRDHGRESAALVRLSLVDAKPISTVSRSSTD
jgi:hypothetical protein